ncbi:hypothetical protein [Winogradskyella sp. 3972H.M.0a.05]|uniref:hypothetical protein n=1 Tax=Winogradskyella sp. 3972H.M.0a.05 TaxID=2950277 RepID=UPI0033963BA0
MKKVKFIIKLFMVLALVGVFQSCEDDEKNRLDEFQLGGFVRFQDPFPNVVNISGLSEVPNISVPVVFEAPDGNVVSYTMRVAASVGGTTYGPVDFGPEITSFPTAFNITMSDLATALNVDLADVGFGDTFGFTGRAVNTDGDVYEGNNPLTYDAETGTAGGGNNSGDLIAEAGYRNAFEFAFAIPCPPITNPAAGDWTINMTDLYGDGWDGAFLTVSIDGTETNYDIVDGDSAVHVFNVPAGTAELRFTYTSGSWEEEHIYEVVDPGSNTFGPFGPFPEMCPSIGL